ncbi:MAG: hypothetical protein VYA55_09120 [Pseudomonadota bacterium]|nr:hypothetical protein [Pseudomonadota bacterium]
MENVYEKPESELINSENAEYTFTSLGIWRKIFIVLSWLMALVITYPALTEFMREDQANPDFATIFLTMSMLHLALCFWMTFAISKRKLGQIVALLALNIFPLFNPIHAIILAAVYFVSKKERAVGQG